MAKVEKYGNFHALTWLILQTWSQFIPIFQLFLKLVLLNDPIEADYKLIS